MKVKFSEDLVPLTTLKLNPAKVIRQTLKSKRPVLITTRGKGIAVLLSLDDFEKLQDELETLREQA
jgi:prevent-host-death family protein